MPFRLEAAILSRMRSPVTSRSNCANDSKTFSVRGPSKWWDTKAKLDAIPPEVLGQWKDVDAVIYGEVLHLRNLLCVPGFGMAGRGKCENGFDPRWPGTLSG
jgi:hypothetical protein